MNALQPPKESSGTDRKKGGQRIQRSGQRGHFDHVPIMAFFLENMIFLRCKFDDGSIKIIAKNDVPYMF